MFLLLNIISIIATLIVIEGVIYFTLNSTIGRISYVKKFEYKDVFFLCIGLILILFFFEFHLPYN
jgi:hypothetical protein